MLIQLCLKIFFVRILDVSMGTFRTITTIKGKKLTATFIGFIEVLIWFLVVKEALNTNETSIWIAISYAAGFATGTYLGTTISQRYIKGNLTVQIITSNKDVINYIRNLGFGVSVVNVEGHEKEKEKYLLFIEINSKSFNYLRNKILEFDKDVFIVVSETKYVQNGFIK